MAKASRRSLSSAIPLLLLMRMSKCTNTLARSSDVQGWADWEAYPRLAIIRSYPFNHSCTAGLLAGFPARGRALDSEGKRIADGLGGHDIKGRKMVSFKARGAMGWATCGSQGIPGSRGGRVAIILSC
jgi:hypothetical protein